MTNQETTRHNIDIFYFWENTFKKQSEQFKDSYK